MKLFVCECGKEYTNSQGFNGHRAHCKVHLALLGDNHIQQRASLSKNALNALNKYNENKHKLKEAEEAKKLQRWIDEKHTCEKCGKIMTEKFATGRFCSRACANGRPQSEETRRKIGVSVAPKVKKYYEEHPNSSKYETRTQEKESIIKQYNSSPNYCCICNKPLDYEHRLTQTCASKKCVNELLRRLQLEKVEAGTHQGWLRRNVMSYPEQFWKQVLDNNNIKYEHDYAVSTGRTHYLLDFFIDGHIDLEIDGGQHELPDAVEHDRKRNEYVQSRGWHVYRIKWINPHWNEEAVIQQITDFIHWYKSEASNRDVAQLLER